MAGTTRVWIVALGVLDLSGRAFASMPHVKPAVRSPASGTALRIMPLGDSITQWQCGLLGNASSPVNDRGDVASFGGYRGPLFESLQRHWGSLYTFESVGGQHGCGSHEGHSGWTCEMLADIIVESATAYEPDVVLLMCGTNDLWYRPSTKNPILAGNVSQVLDRITLILQRLYSVVPQATVLLSTISDINATKCLTYPEGPCPATMPADIVAVNDALDSRVVAPFTAAGRAIHLHDVNTDAQWEEADYFTWGIHRSEAGFKKMAMSWEKSILAHVIPPIRSCESALTYSCGPEQTQRSKNATLCENCLAKPPVQHMLAQYNCSTEAQAKFCQESGSYDKIGGTAQSLK